MNTVWLNCIRCGKTVTIELKSAGMIEAKAVCTSCSHKYEIVDGKLVEKKKTEWVEEIDVMGDYD